MAFSWWSWCCFILDVSPLELWSWTPGSVLLGHLFLYWNILPQIIIPSTTFVAQIMKFWTASFIAAVVDNIQDVFCPAPMRMENFSSSRYQIIEIGRSKPQCGFAPLVTKQKRAAWAHSCYWVSCMIRAWATWVLCFSATRYNILLRVRHFAVHFEHVANGDWVCTNCFRQGRRMRLSAVF